MKHAKNSESPEATPDPAAQSRSRDHLSQPTQDEDSIEATALARADATLTLLSAWLVNLQTLVRLEFRRTLAASKQILLLQLVLYPLAIAFLLSLCAGVGLIGYYYSQSIYIGFAAFVLAQLLILIGILLYQRTLHSMLGFEQSKQQTKQALNDVLEIFK